MRKTTPFLILAVGLLALAIDLLPNLKLPNTGAEGGSRPIETKLGLDLRGGLRVEYQVQPVEGVVATPADVATIRDIIERRVNSTGVAEPLVSSESERYTGSHPSRRANGMSGWSSEKSLACRYTRCNCPRPDLTSKTFAGG